MPAAAGEKEGQRSGRGTSARRSGAGERQRRAAAGRLELHRWEEGEARGGRRGGEQGAGESRGERGGRPELHQRGRGAEASDGVWGYFCLFTAT